MTIDIEQIKRYHKHCKDMLGTFKIVGHERELDDTTLSLTNKMEVLCDHIDALLALLVDKVVCNKCGVVLPTGDDSFVNGLFSAHNAFCDGVLSKLEESK